MATNVLISSAGRRVSLLKSFASVVHPSGGRVLASDASSLAPALYHSDGAVQLPRIEADDYLAQLLLAVEKHQIDLLVPTIDTELSLLAEHRDEFLARGCTPLVSSPDVVAASADKARTQSFMRRHGIAVPRGWGPDEIEGADLPPKLFVKPRDGSSSMHCHEATVESLDEVLRSVPNPIIQEFVTGPEITIDALLDLSGRPIHCVPRLRLRTSAGESIQGVTIDDGDLRPWLLTALEALAGAGAIGPITLQAFLTDDGPVLIEVNPRFGGGFPLTDAAGGCYPRLLVDMLEKRPVEPAFGDYQRDLHMTRYYAETFTTSPLW